MSIQLLSLACLVLAYKGSGAVPSGKLLGRSILDDPALDPLPKLPRPKTAPKQPITLPVKDPPQESKVYSTKSKGQNFQRFGHLVNANNGVLAVSTFNANGGNFISYFCESTVNEETTVRHQWEESNSIAINDRDQVLSMDADNGYIFLGIEHAELDGNQRVVYAFPPISSESCEAVATWTLASAQALTSPTADVSIDLFGSSVTVNRDIAIIGSPSYDTEGAAYVYEYNSEISSWELIYKLTAGDDSSNHASFGYATAATDSIIAVSARHDNAITGQSGAVYVFDILVVSPTPPLPTATPSVAPSWSTISPSVEDDIIVESISLEDQDEEKSTKGFKLAAKLQPFDETSTFYFGRVMSFMENCGFISATEESGQGSVYVFERSEQTLQWSQVKKFTSEDSKWYTRFGDSLAVTSYQGKSMAIVGSPSDDMNGELSGALYLYGKKDTEWMFFMKVSGASTDNFDAYGSSIDVSNDLLFVGAELAQGYTNRSGAVYVEDNILEYMASAMDSSDSGAGTSSSGSGTSSQSPYVMILVVVAVLPAIAIAAILANRAVKTFKIAYQNYKTTHTNHPSFSIELDDDPNDADHGNYDVVMAKSEHDSDDGQEFNNASKNPLRKYHQRLSSIEIDI